MRLIAPILLATACSANGPSLEEPTSGRVYDRALVEVRMEPPPDSVTPGGQVISTGAGTQKLAHADWRTNGGMIQEAVPTTNEAANHNYVFSLALEAGANHLEIGNCDVADKCDWTAVDVTLQLAPGSPDPAFAHGGILAYPPNFSSQNLTASSGWGGGAVWPQADGRVLAIAFRGSPQNDQALVAFAPDGTIDGNFGMFGGSTLPATAQGTLLLVPATDGWYLLAQGNGILHHVHADGTFDAAFSRQLDPAMIPGTFRRDPAGGYFVGGLCAGPCAITLHLDDDGTPGPSNQTAFTANQVVASTFDADGHVVLLEDTQVQLGDGSTVALPDPVGTGSIAVAANGDVFVTVAALDAQTQAAVTHVHCVHGGTIASTSSLPFHTNTFLAPAPDGAVYVAGQWTAPPDGEPGKWYPDAGPSEELGIARFVDGSQDMAFGTGGIAHANPALAWQPMSTEKTTTTPAALAIGPDGAPWMSGNGTAMTDSAGYTRRGPSLVIAKFMH